MTRRRRSYSEEFKRETVQLMETSGKPIAQIARDLGINDNNLYRWRAKYGRSADNGNAVTREALAAELRQVKRENAILRQERDVLKKAMHIVSRSQP